ncbi:MAG: HNH endonuclease [Terrimicrobiaceae bacterium]|nr:HNH endonuclease [Terrimicrobiaceae bacterium]
MAPACAGDHAKSKWGYLTGDVRCKNTMRFLPSHNYSSAEIHSSIGGGNVQSYLPQRDGKILCGKFDRAKNIQAPIEIDVGGKPKVVKGALLLSKAEYSIPVFLKKGSGVWEFVGDYVCQQYSTAPGDLYPQNPTRRPDAVGVLYLQRVYTDNDTQPVLDLARQEGELKLRLHYIRERDPSLAIAKKNTCRKLSGYLQCECCGLKSTLLPTGHADSCFEVHHLTPLSAGNGIVKTTLNDLALLCALCHRMIHANQCISTISELKNKIERADAPNYHAFGTFGTSPAEQALVPKASGSR